MYKSSSKIDFGNCTNISEIEREFKVSTKAGLERFKKVLTGYPVPSGNTDRHYRFVWIDDEYCAIDEEIADLIQFLNENDFPTQYCCAGHRTEISKISPTCQSYIMFRRTERVYHLLTFVFKEITGELLDNYNGYNEIRVFSNKKYEQHSDQHMGYLESLRQRKYIVMNNRKSFFTSMSFEGENTIRFKYKPEQRMLALHKFSEMMMRIGKSL